MNEKQLRISLKRRVGTYKGKYPAEMLDTNFKCIFSKTQREMGLPKYDIQNIINNSTKEQLQRMHDELSNYQLDKRLFK